MRDWDGERVAAAAGAEVVARGADGGPARATIDSRQAGEGDLFFGLPGEHADGGEFAAAALEAGAWGVVVTPEHAEGLEGGWVLAAADPLAALQSLAHGWRRELGARVVGITGSTGKTSVKDICRGDPARRTRPRQPRELQHRDRPAAGDPRGRAGRELLVLEMAMRGAGPDRRALRDRRARRRS